MKKLIITLILITSSCTQIESDKTVLDLNNIEIETSSLSDYFEVKESICLEINNRDYISRVDKIVKTKKYFILLNKFEQNTLFLFSLKGELLKELKSSDLEQYNTNQFYDVLYDKHSNQIELLTDTGIFYLAADDLSYISKQALKFSATRFSKSKNFYHFVTPSESGLTIINSSFNSSNKITYLPENNTMPFYQMASLNSFTNFEGKTRYFRNFDNSIYTLEKEKLTTKWTIDFNETDLTDQERNNIKNPQEVYQIRDKSLLHKFYFETKNLIYLSFFKNEEFTVCLIDKSNKNSTCFDVVNSDNNLTNEDYFPFIMNTTVEGNFIALKNLEGNNEESCDSDFKIYELKFKQLK